MNAGTDRFTVGALVCIAVSDGAFAYPDHSFFVNAPKEQLEQVVPAEKVVCPVQDVAGHQRTRILSSPRTSTIGVALLRAGIAALDEIALRASSLAKRARDTVWGRSWSHGAVLRDDQLTRVQAALRSYR